MDQDGIRRRVRILKATKSISYKQLAEYLAISKSSMYNWIHNQYDFSEERAQQLDNIVKYLGV